ncbi:uncharacterized protein Z520_06195 [Fonsecaea multimorphosa CBS 102226]|uniref:Uncharacterized protein n=1 Tax=Fonsecaea multimorphosa CBS 102226 TaxID=1442371 RepID=A0A0D2H8D2_9EURO|nr:uncharacterized protein Z520_06195 [Fonsecaea multimorphosa CBS 102226]KIX98115.1 hypothetical protein Z520_06195 [Fonsecaea multimorphosa CBS 102226]
MSAKFLERHRLEIVELYMWSGLSGKPLKEMMVEIENKCELECKCGPAPRCQKKYKDYFKLCGVFKNNEKVEIDEVQSRLAERILPDGDYLILADGMVLDPLQIQNYRGKAKKKNDDACPGSNLPPRRSIEVIEVPCPIPALKDPHKFRVFQRFLWLATQHFNSCFDHNIWKKDGGDPSTGGDLRADLKKLSNLHNMLVDACQHPERRGVLEPKAFNTLQVVANTNHHRQMPDILAVLLLLERSGRSDLKASLVQRLSNLAESMELNDPRRRMLDTLNSLPIDKDGHLPLAFDSCCRDLWRRRFRGDDLMACYTYYQAPFPEALRPPSIICSKKSQGETSIASCTKSTRGSP